MKKIAILLAFVVSTTCLFAQNNPFERFSDMDGVTSVYISKNMLKLFPKNTDTDYGGVKVGDFLHKLSSILILTTENKDVGKQMMSLANNQVKSPGYELLMRVRTEDKTKVNFFMKGKPENIHELIMIVDGGDDDSVIMQFLGDFTLQDIQKMTESFDKN